MDVNIATAAIAAAPKVVKEQAIEEFETMCRARRVELDMTDLTEPEVKRFENIKRKLVKCIMAGVVTIAQDGTPTFTARGGAQAGKVFKFKQATGAAVVSQDGKEGQARVSAAMAELSGLNVGEFAKLEMADLEIVDAFYMLFFLHESSI